MQIIWIDYLYSLKMPIRYFEEYKVGESSPDPTGWAFPALFETQGHWILLSEAGLNENYAGFHLQPEAPNGVYSVRFPEDFENDFESQPSVQLPFETSWKTIVSLKT